MARVAGCEVHAGFMLAGASAVPGAMLAQGSALALGRAGASTSDADCSYVVHTTLDYVVADLDFLSASIARRRVAISFGLVKRLSMPLCIIIKKCYGPG